MPSPKRESVQLSLGHMATPGTSHEDERVWWNRSLGSLLNSEVGEWIIWLITPQDGGKTMLQKGTRDKKTTKWKWTSFLCSWGCTLGVFSCLHFSLGLRIPSYNGCSCHWYANHSHYRPVSCVMSLPHGWLKGRWTQSVNSELVLITKPVPSSRSFGSANEIASQSVSWPHQE